MNVSIRNKILLILTVAALAGSVVGQTTAFNYQGSLKDGGNPANGSFQMQFKLFDSLGGAGQIGSTITDVAVTVNQGVFSVKLDFGANALSGANRWLEIAVRRNSGESYVTLSPREQIASAPYSVRTLSAASADGLSGACVGCVQDANINSVSGTKVTGTVANATNATNAANSAQLGGVAANQFVQTNDARLSDARNPLPGSGNYIQNNPPAQQSLSSFDISGNALIGGTIGLSAAGKIIWGTNTTGRHFEVFQSGNKLHFVRWDPPPEGFGYSELTILDSGPVMIGPGSDGQHKLVVQGGPPWTGHAWIGSVELPNTGAIGWRPNTNNWSFGMGQTTWGLSFFRTQAPLGGGFPGANPIYAMNIDNNGNVGIGTRFPDLSLTVNGNASKIDGGSWAVLSDERLKTIGKPFTSGLSAVMQLQPIHYRYKQDNALGVDSAGAQIGFSAQSVSKIIPEAVSTNHKGYLMINNDPILWTMLNAIKEQQAQIDALKKLVCSQNPQADVCKEKKQ